MKEQLWKTSHSTTKIFDHKHLDEVLMQTGLLEFIKKQTHGIQTVLHPEGQKIPYTISKRILLARAIIHQPSLLILKDPLEYFEDEEAKRIIKYLTSPDRNWALIVSSKNQLWKQNCDRSIVLNNGTLMNNNAKDA